MTDPIKGIKWAVLILDHGPSVVDRLMSLGKSAEEITLEDLDLLREKLQPAKPEDYGLKEDEI